MTTTPAQPSTDIDMLEMIGHKQVHGAKWRCRMCLLERGGFYDSFEELSEHLTGGPLKGGHQYENLILDSECVWIVTGGEV